ncbi:MAG: alpha/beta hydrolase [Thiolinea sp.]
MVISSFAELDSLLRGFVPERYAGWRDSLLWAVDAGRWLRGEDPLRNIRPRQWAANLQLPVLVVHGDADRYVPQAQGQALFAALPGTDKHWLSVPGGGHRNVLATAMPLYAAMSEWLLQRANTAPLTLSSHAAAPGSPPARQ